jgi:type I restriction enzyme, R subunit
VVLKARLAAAVAHLNPALPPEAQANPIRHLTQEEIIRLRPDWPAPTTRPATSKA